MKKLWIPLLVVIGLLISHFATAATFYSARNGKWEQKRTWFQDQIGHRAERAPGPGDHVVICHQVARAGDLDIQGTAVIQIIGTGDLLVQGDLRIASGARLANYAVMHCRDLLVRGGMENFGRVELQEYQVSGTLTDYGTWQEVSAALDFSRRGLLRRRLETRGDWAQP